MKKISLLVAIILMTPLLAWCSLFGKKMSFEDAYNSLFVPENMAEVIEKIDKKAPFWQKTKFTFDGSYNDMVSLTTRLDTVGNYDVTNNIADVDLAFTANFNLDKSFMQSFWWWASNSLLNTRPQESDTEIDNKQQLTDSMFNNRSQGMQQGWIEIEQIEQNNTVNSQNNIPQESFSPKTVPTAEPTSDSAKKTFELPMTKDVRSEAGSGKSETNVDVSFSGKIQLNSSGLYANVEKMVIDMMPNDVYDTKSLTKAINTVANQWINLMPIGQPGQEGFLLSFSSGDDITNNITNKVTDFLKVFQNSIKTYPLLQETEKTKIDGNVAYWIARSQEGVSWFVNELVNNLDVSEFLWLLSEFWFDDLPTEQLKNKPLIASMISSVIVQTPLSGYIILHDEDVVELRILSLQIWEMNLKASLFTNDTATFEMSFADGVAVTWDVSKLDGATHTSIHIIPINSLLTIDLKDGGKSTTLVFSGMWAKVQIGFENETKQLDSYQPIQIIDSKPIEEIMKTIENTITGMTGEGVFINRQSQTNKRALNVQKMTSLSQIGQWLWMYASDNGAYPNLNDPTFSVESLENILVPTYFASLPKDPTPIYWQHFGWEMKTWYIYIPILSDWKPNKSILLISNIQPVEYDAWRANWVDVNNQLVNLPDPTKLEASKIAKLICSKITITDTTEDNLAKCTAKKDSTALRYVYMQ